MNKRQTILAHFQTFDPVIIPFLDQVSFERKIIGKNPDQYYAHLVENIIGQQLSVKVADVIIDRFKHLFENATYSPTQIIQIETEVLRSIGMSYAKIKYIKDLSARTNEKSIQYSDFIKMSDEEVISQLTKVKGIGPWTAEMFLIFSLGRENVFSFGDGGLQRAITNLYSLDPKQDFTKIMSLTEKWSPYKSYASLALWHSLDNSPKK